MLLEEEKRILYVIDQSHLIITEGSLVITSVFW